MIDYYRKIRFNDIKSDWPARFIHFTGRCSLTFIAPFRLPASCLLNQCRGFCTENVETHYGQRQPSCIM